MLAYCGDEMLLELNRYLLLLRLARMYQEIAGDHDHDLDLNNKLLNERCARLSIDGK